MHRFLQLIDKPELSVLGIMTGTSIDGVDMALTNFSGLDAYPKFTVNLTRFYEMPPELRKEIQACFTGNTEQICRLNKKIGMFLSGCVQQFMSKTECRPDLIACHGQTVYHISGHSTLQIGDSDCIAKLCKIPTVFDFRSADTVFGGTGAPLVPVFDRLLNYPHKKSTIFQNLGGIGNLTFIPANNPEHLIAFDTGPANILSDCIMRIHSHGQTGYDRDGATAKKGNINHDLLKTFLSHPYLKESPPKSTGHEVFGMTYVKEIMKQFNQISLENMLRTANRFVAELNVKAYQDFCPGFEQVYLTGGGSKNPVLCAEFVDLLGKEKLLSFTDTFGFDPDFKEAVAFAYLGYCRCRNIPSNVPKITCASQEVILGKLALP